MKIVKKYYIEEEPAVAMYVQLSVCDTNGFMDVPTAHLDNHQKLVPNYLYSSENHTFE